MVYKEIDLAAAASAKGSALAASDVIEAITVGANTLIMFADAEITTAPSGTSGASFDLVITDGDVGVFVDGMTLIGASAGTYGTLANTACPLIITALDSNDWVLLGTTPDTAGKVRVFDVLMHVNGMGSDNGADEVGRDYLA